MNADIRFAGVSQEMENRVHLAAKALLSFGIRATAGPWEGSGCTLVVLDAEDTYGRHVFDVASRRRVLVTAVGGKTLVETRAIASAANDISVSALSRLMLKLLAPEKWARLERLSPAKTQSSRPAIHPKSAKANDPSSIWTRLTTDLAGCDVLAKNGSRTIQLLRSKGRVRATTLSDMLSARDTLTDAEWSLSEIKGAVGTAEVTESLDVFLLDSAIRGNSHLPSFGPNRGRLIHWPDIGGAPDTIDALRVCGLLMQRPHSAEEIASSAAIPLPLVNACFWAFAAAGLLEPELASQTGRSSTTPVREPSGLLTRLAMHFGLISRSPLR